MGSVQRVLALVAIAALGLSGSRCLGATTGETSLDGMVLPSAVVDPHGDDPSNPTWSILLSPVVDVDPTQFEGPTEGDLAGGVELDVHGNTDVDLIGPARIKLRNTADSGAFMDCKVTMYGYVDDDSDLAPYDRHSSTVGYSWNVPTMDELGYQVLHLVDSTSWVAHVDFDVPHDVWTVETRPGVYTHTVVLTVTPHL